MCLSAIKGNTNTCRIQLNGDEESCLASAQELLGNARVAFLHDWLTGMRGGERCLEVLCGMFPNSEVYTLFASPDNICESIRSRIRYTSFLNCLPGIQRYYRYLLPIFPVAAWHLQHKLAKAHRHKPYDAVISISHCAVKNICPPPNVKHICYCLTPVRYLWDQYQTYFGKSRFEPLIRPLASLLRAWDRKGAKHVHKYIAISKYVADRISRYYGRDSEIVYPPVDFSWLDPIRDEERLKDEAVARFVCVCALVPYKRVDQVILAFNELPYKLTIVGQGPEYTHLRSLAGPNIEFISGLSDSELAQIYRDSSAMVFLAEEDFGMSTVEMQASGRPVIAFYRGGSAEIISGLSQRHLAYGNTFSAESNSNGNSIDDLGFSGILLDDITSDSIKKAIRFLLANPNVFKPENCRNSAQRFSIKHFCDLMCNHYLRFI